LNEIYPFASKKSKEDEVFKVRAKDITGNLQGGHEGYLALWREIMRVSVEDLKANYSKLNVDFDLWYGESDAEKDVPELLEILGNQDLMYESDGAMIVDVAKEEDKAPVPPIIIKKSDNSNMYSTTDLATIIQRQRDFAPDRVWYVVDKRQELHFTQVFRCAKKANLTAAELEHLGFGTMNGSDGKPYKTRDGGVMRLSDFLETIISAAQEKMSESGFVSGDDKENIAQRVAVAAIKFGDLSNHRLRDYIFDIDKFLAFEGKTGTYLVYTVSRINSILKKLGNNITPAFQKIYTDIEREILLNIILTGEVFNRAVNERAPNYICDNAYKLATLFSSFYHDNHIGKEQDEDKKDAWLSLCVLVRDMLCRQLDVLGIETVEHM
ncbi:MAG: arginine--tRNA ligase, partial [Oscillospiraceae bacterium]|nr:arginine--tRNA ligase [Oscillospiraceae bacterium]